MPSINIFDQFQGFTPSMEELGSGVVDEYCGCMLSKWISVEFRKIVGLQKDYLQFTIVYMEPFTDFDYKIVCIDWHRIPKSLMQVYELAKSQTVFNEAYDTVDMIVPFAYKPNRTLLKRLSKHIHKLSGDIVCVDEEGYGTITYIATSTDISKIDNIFKSVMQS